MPQIPPAQVRLVTIGKSEIRIKSRDEVGHGNG